MIKLVAESLKMFEEQKYKDMDIHITKDENFVTVFLDTGNWDTKEEAYDDIYNFSSDLLQQIEENIYPPYRIDHAKMERVQPHIEYVDSYFEKGEENEVWTIDLPIYNEEEPKKKKKRKLF